MADMAEPVRLAELAGSSVAGSAAAGSACTGRVRLREIATPARHSAPPRYASGRGVSPRNAHDISTTRTGTMYVVTPILPAVVRFSAYAQVVNASAVGTTPR